jgi:aspartate/methionine/tyrosine aminotransferase
MLQTKAPEPTLAPRVTAIGPSATVEMTERVRAARAAGKPVLPLSSGDPNLPTHPAVIEAAHRAMLNGDTHYGPSPGLPALREAIAARLTKRTKMHTTADEVLITPGGKFAVFAALTATVMPGDEVIVFDPCWVSYHPCIQLCGGTTVVIPALDEVPLDKIEAAITPRTRMIIVNSPVNPTGRVLTRAELSGLARLAREHNFWLLFDQVYSDLVFDGGFTFLQTLDDAKNRTFIADSLSKTYGMTGWRTGFVVAPSHAVKPLLRVIQHSIYCVPPFIQHAAVAALQLPDSVVESYVGRFRRHRDKMVDALNGLNGISCTAPPATFYVFPFVGGDDRKVAEQWLDTLSIASVPGSAFGAGGTGHLRLSLTCSDQDIDSAIEKLKSHYGAKKSSEQAASA